MPKNAESGQQRSIGNAVDLRNEELDKVTGGLRSLHSQRTARKKLAIQQGRVVLDADYND